MGLVGRMHGLWISILQFSALSQATENEGYEVMGPGRGVEGEKEIRGLPGLAWAHPSRSQPLLYLGHRGFLTFSQDQHLLRT